MSKAMVIDDSRAIRMILGGILEELGYDVRHATNGKDALRTMEQEPGFSLFLVDWNMPEMNGFDFLQTIRRSPVHQSTPVMMVTTETETSQIEKALAAGANEYVMKPFTKDIIREKLRMMGIDK